MEPAVWDRSAPAPVARRPVAVVRLPRREKDGHGGGLRDEDEHGRRSHDRELPDVVADAPVHSGDRAPRLSHSVADDVLAGPGERRDDDADPLDDRELPQGEAPDTFALGRRDERLAPGG